MQIGNFELKVRRSVAGAHAAAPAPVVSMAHVHVDPAPVAAPPPPGPEDTVDESLVYVNAPKVCWCVSLDRRWLGCCS